MACISDFTVCRNWKSRCNLGVFGSGSQKAGVKMPSHCVAIWSPILCSVSLLWDSGPRLLERCLLPLGWQEGILKKKQERTEAASFITD